VSNHVDLETDSGLLFQNRYLSRSMAFVARLSEHSLPQKRIRGGNVRCPLVLCLCSKTLLSKILPVPNYVFGLASPARATKSNNTTHDLRMSTLACAIPKMSSGRTCRDFEASERQLHVLVLAFGSVNSKDSRQQNMSDEYLFYGLHDPHLAD